MKNELCYSLFFTNTCYVGEEYVDHYTTEDRWIEQLSRENQSEEE